MRSGAHPLWGGGLTGVVYLPLPQGATYVHSLLVTLASNARYSVPFDRFSDIDIEMRLQLLPNLDKFSARPMMNSNPSVETSVTWADVSDGIVSGGVVFGSVFGSIVFESCYSFLWCSSSHQPEKVSPGEKLWVAA